jgi:hypothetical protein
MSLTLDTLWKQKKRLWIHFEERKKKNKKLTLDTLGSKMSRAALADKFVDSHATRPYENHDAS